MGRAPCCDKVGLKKGPWTIEEDQKLTAYIQEHGHGSWRALPKKAGLFRCGKSCRLRWTNYLRPDIKRGEFSSGEEQTVIQLHALLGNRWSAIATHLPRRTDNEIKNYWNTHLKKRLIKMGLDPATHKPAAQTPISNSSNSQSEPASTTTGGSSSITHMAQWESVRLEAEARLAREAEMRAKGMWPPQVKTRPDSTEFPLKGPYAYLMQSCGGFMMPTMAQETSSCNATNILDHVKIDSSTYMTSLKRNPSLSMMPLKQEMDWTCNTMSSTELMNSLHNWENSLQGQVGMMWPDSWKLYNSSSNNSGECQESSSCSSPSHGTTNQGSPTSTLCSLDRLSKRQSSCNLTPSTQGKKLWADNNFLNILNPLFWVNQPMRPPPFNHLDDGLQGAASNSDCGEGGLMGMASLQEFMQRGGLNDRSEGSLLIRSNSSDFLGDLDLVSEDISSSHQSASAEASVRQVSYSELLGDEYTESEWNSMLKEDAEDAPSLQGKTTVYKEELPL